MGPAHRREALDLIDVGDGHDPGQDGHFDARGPRPAQELEVAPVVEEELGDEEVRPGIHLAFAVPQVLDQVARLRMALRITGRADTELDAALVRDLPREQHQIRGVREPVGVGDELALAARRIAAEREHVADPGIADDAELLLQLLARGAHAGEVSHGLDLGVALDARHHLQRAPPRGPARAPGHADERGPERAQGAERFEQRGHPRVVLRREEFEREDWLSALRREAEHVRDPHRRGFSSAGASLSADARRRLRRRLRRESSWPVPGAAAGTTFAARTDAAQPGTLQGVEQSASVKASITLPAMSFTLPLVWHPHTCTVA